MARRVPFAPQTGDVEGFRLQARREELGDVDHRLLGRLHILAFDPFTQFVVEGVKPDREEDEKAQEDTRGRAHNASRSE